MRILILTSSNHLYANLALNRILSSPLFKSSRITVWEQSSLVPKKSFFQGLSRYYQISGPVYIFFQFLKQSAFVLGRTLAVWLNSTSSTYYPYFLNSLVDFSRKEVNGLHLPDRINEIRRLAPDLILSLYSKEIIPPEIIKIPRLGIVNLHPAYLPLNRGVSPTFWCLVKNEKYSGVTLHYIDSKIDTGSIISQVKIPLSHFKTEHALYVSCTLEGVKLLEAYLKHLNSHSPARIFTHPNPNSQATYNSLPTRRAVHEFLKQGYRFFTSKELLFPQPV